MTGLAGIKNHVCLLFLSFPMSTFLPTSDPSKFVSPSFFPSSLPRPLTPLSLPLTLVSLPLFLHSFLLLIFPTSLHRGTMFNIKTAVWGQRWSWWEVGRWCDYHMMDSCYLGDIFSVDHLAIASYVIIAFHLSQDLNIFNIVFFGGEEHDLISKEYYYLFSFESS